MIKSVAKAKPDKFEPFTVQWLRERYTKELPRGMAEPPADSWVMRTDVPPTESAFTDYLLEIRLPILLQRAVEAALLMKPDNVPVFLLDFFTQSAEEAVKAEALLRERAVSMPPTPSSRKPKATGPKQKLEGGTALTLSYEVGDDGKLSVDFSLTN